MDNSDGGSKRIMSSLSFILGCASTYRGWYVAPKMLDNSPFPDGLQMWFPQKRGIPAIFDYQRVSISTAQCRRIHMYRM